MRLRSGASGAASGAPVSAAAYCEALRRRAGIMLLPSSLFGPDDDRVRLTFGREETPGLLKRWSADLAAHALEV